MHEKLSQETDYKKMLVEIINEIKSEKFLAFIYDMILSFKEKWGI